MRSFIIFFASLLASTTAAEERFCFDDAQPNKLWISGAQVLGNPFFGPYVLEEEFIDRCYEGELPRLAALSRVMSSMPHICRISPACEYDLDGDGVVGLSDVASLISEALSTLNATCREGVR